MSFGGSLTRRLLAPSALVGYLAVWVLLIIALLATMVFLSSPPKELIFPFSLGIVLLVPLARIGFCPIALALLRSGRAAGFTAERAIYAEGPAE